jgi:hypothetical protein
MMMTRKMFALVTHQGTATPETAICSECAEVTTFYAEQRADSDVDKQRGFVDVTGNEAIDECTSCGWTKGYQND